jgi:hypothetical protein
VHQAIVQDETVKRTTSAAARHRATAGGTGPGEPFHLFGVDQLVMHHMNFVRRDLEARLLSSSNAHGTDYMQELRAALGAWQFGQTLTLPRKPHMNIVQVENRFAPAR